MTRLFDKNKVSKFFTILNKLSGSIPVDKSNYPWKDYQTIYTKDSNHVPCTREVFTHRTIYKWLRGKYLILYKKSDIGIDYKQYIYVSTLNYQNNWGMGYIRVSIIDFSKPFELFLNINIQCNDALYLEGEWCNNSDKHNLLLSLVSMEDVPDKEYVFVAYDLNKLPTKRKMGVDVAELMKTTFSVTAKTEQQAHDKVKNLKDSKFVIGELIETKL